MKKKLRLIGRSRLTIEQWCKGTYQLPLIPNWVYSRHLRRSAKYKSRDGTAIIDLGNDWYVHSYRNGLRILSVLPF